MNDDFEQRMSARMKEFEHNLVRKLTIILGIVLVIDLELITIFFMLFPNRR